MQDNTLYPECNTTIAFPGSVYIAYAPKTLALMAAMVSWNVPLWNFFMVIEDFQLSNSWHRSECLVCFLFLNVWHIVGVRERNIEYCQFT